MQKKRVCDVPNKNVRRRPRWAKEAAFFSRYAQLAVHLSQTPLPAEQKSRLALRSPKPTACPTPDPNDRALLAEDTLALHQLRRGPTNAGFLTTPDVRQSAGNVNKSCKALQLLECGGPRPATLAQYEEQCCLNAGTQIFATQCRCDYFSCGFTDNR
jgi:hypothetical protein